MNGYTLLKSHPDPRVRRIGAFKPDRGLLQLLHLKADLYGALPGRRAS